MTPRRLATLAVVAGLLGALGIGVALASGARTDTVTVSGRGGRNTGPKILGRVVVLGDAATRLTPSLALAGRDAVRPITVEAGAGPDDRAADAGRPQPVAALLVHGAAFFGSTAPGGATSTPCTADYAAWYTALVLGEIDRAHAKVAPGAPVLVTSLAPDPEAAPRATPEEVACIDDALRAAAASRPGVAVFVDTAEMVEAAEPTRGAPDVPAWASSVVEATVGIVGA